jgi:hypothetical protein
VSEFDAKAGLRSNPKHAIAVALITSARLLDGRAFMAASVPSGDNYTGFAGVRNAFSPGNRAPLSPVSKTAARLTSVALV